MQIHVLADDSLPVDRFGFERVCRRAAADATATVRHVAAGDLPDAVRGARRGGEAVLLCAPAQGSSEDLRDAVLEPAPAPLVWLDLTAPFAPRPTFQDPARVVSIRGRGLEGVAWGMRSLVARTEVPPTAHRYGDDVEHVGDLRVPVHAEPPWPVIVLIHGGGWRERWERDLMDGIASDLTRRGYATWNLEFRRVGASGGGWPTTFADVARGIDHLAELRRDAPLDLDRVVAVGHSAGGHLAFLAAARPRLLAGAVGAEPVVPVVAAVGLAGVYDLVSSAERGMDELSTIAFAGGRPSERPDVYAVASPAALLPIGVEQLVVVGVDDRPDLVDDNRRYVEDARAAGDDVDLMELPNADHFTVIDPSTLTWFAIAERLTTRFPPASPRLEPDSGGLAVSRA